MVAYILSGVIAYLIGSISSSVIISKKMAGFDVREKGSGNAGSTNVLRSVGKKAALITLICDIFKGIVAIAMAVLIGVIFKDANSAYLVQVAAVLVIIGHTYPIFFGFKGGKGVATSLGILLLLNWKVGLICLVFALILMILTRMVSLGSISAAVLFPILAIPFKDGFLIEGDYLIFAIIMALIVIFNHRTNIKRLIAGTENKISFKKKDKEETKEEAKEETKTEIKEEVPEKVEEVKEEKTEEVKSEVKEEKKSKKKKEKKEDK